MLLNKGVVYGTSTINLNLNAILNLDSINLNQGTIETKNQAQLSAESANFIQSTLNIRDSSLLEIPEFNTTNITSSTILIEKSATLLPESQSVILGSGNNLIKDGALGTDNQLQMLVD